MRFVFAAAVAAAIAIPGALAVPAAGAAPNANGACRQAVHDLLVASSSEGTVGDAVSDGIYGNEPNVTNTNTNDDLGPNQVDPGSGAGFIEPSLSPGPKVNNPLDPDNPLPGPSMGDIQRTFIKPVCNG